MTGKVTVTFSAPTHLSRKVQNLVKKYDGRFEYNPLVLFKYTRFSISFENENVNKFMNMVDILNQPYV